MKNHLILLSFLVFIIIFLNFANICASEPVKKSVDDNRDDETADDGKEESMEIPSESDTNNATMCTRKKNSLVHEIQTASYNQYPFIAAIMSARQEYLCAGSIVSNGMILTTAQCAETANHILINITSAKKDETAITLNIVKYEPFPTHAGKNKNVAIIYSDKFNNTVASKIKVSNNTKIEGLIEIEALGFGLNSQVGQIRSLQSVGLESELTFEMNQAFINCIETKNELCFKDTGGPVIIADELIGIVDKGENDCTGQISATYAASKHMVDFLAAKTFKAWLYEKITKNEEKLEESLEIYPKKPVIRQAVHTMTSLGYFLIPNYMYTFGAHYILKIF